MLEYIQIYLFEASEFPRSYIQRWSEMGYISNTIFQWFGYDTNNINSNEIHASMPEVFVFGFGAIVFWNFADETSEKEWINQHISPHTDALGLKHNIESIDTACDEMGFCYGDSFRWRRDVVQLHTKDAGEKMAVSFAFAKSANLSIYEWRLEQAVSKVVLRNIILLFQVMGRL